MDAPTSQPDSASASAAASDSAHTSGSRLLRDLSTIPNLISLSRLFFIMGAVVFYINGFPIVGLVLGFTCGISDYLDGWLARKYNQVTELGEILDRLGDLVYESIAFIFAIYFNILPPYLFMAYIFREIVVMSARQYVSEHKHRGIVMKSSFFGRLKTNLIGYSFLAIFLAHADVVPVWWLVRFFEIGSVVAIIIGLICSYIAGYQYLSAFVRTYDAGENPASNE